MRAKLKHILTKIKEGLLQEMWLETKWIYTYARRYWKSMIFYTLLGLFGTIVSLGSSLVSRDLVDVITGHQTGLLVSTFSLFIGLSIGNIVVSQISSYASNWISLHVDSEIKADVFDKIVVTDWESITNYHTGDLLTRWSLDASNISSGILNWLPNLVIYTVRFLSTLGLVLYYDPTFALLAMLGLPVSALMSRTLMKRMKTNNKKSAAMNAKMSGFNQETFSNLQTIKAFDLLKLYGQRLRELQHEYITMKMDFQKLSLLTSIIMSLVGIVVSYSCYAWGIYRVWSGVISYGTMTMFLSLSSSLTSTLTSLISLVPSAISLTTSAGRLMDILDMPREDYSKEEEAGGLKIACTEQGASLIIEKMDYSYHTGTPIFADASLEAHPREIVALVGPSGEGKTTLLRILLSLLHPQKGSCYLFPSKEREKALELSPATRKLFSYVPQGNTMFSGTISENMRAVKPDATDEEITNALKTACAWDFVKKLPEGIDAMIKERGIGFSEGQAQRLSIARALLRRSPILLLDEATSALDVKTERQLLKNISTDEYPRTCIITSHRPTALEICTKVYALKDKACYELSQDEIQNIIQEF